VAVGLGDDEGQQAARLGGHRCSLRPGRAGERLDMDARRVLLPRDPPGRAEEAVNQDRPAGRAVPRLQGDRVAVGIDPRTVRV
jgi:hypothetical protein